DGSAIPAGAIQANGIYDFVYDGVHWQFGGATTRPLVLANFTYYVRTDGSDSNTGLANTSGAAFLTIQKAVTIVQGLDLNGFTVTIQVADGTYTGGVSANVPFVGGTVLLNGNTTTPAN